MNYPPKVYLYRRYELSSKGSFYAGEMNYPPKVHPMPEK